ncbi:uncharacterized protein LOC125044289 isoform X2 [Penaeus chinensis]|uniref:uncharacterized protein LOC125044289 isoform X2 n=1 Tax=Penaeus chinensis TaxID=139456 RepID=UPI001FB717ED|nr:uncharacterized protein LOC125044289 isoform X2 [Penaeus chinensis]XP_047496839.1 uncharacterized protein LOC125044289 isoform X2 [Penaeus chinensis]
MIASDQLSGVQKTSAGYSYRRVPVARSPTRRLDALKEKHQMLLESMRKQFNMEVNVDRRDTEHLGEESMKIAKKQVTSARSCKPLSPGQKSEAQDANMTKRESKSSSEIQLDCYVKLIPLRSSPRRNTKSTKKEEQVLATETVHLDVPNPSPQNKKMADVDQFSNRLPNASAGNPHRRVLVPRSATRKPGAQKDKQLLSESKSVDSRETSKEGLREKAVKIEQKPITSSRTCKSIASGLRTEAQEINKTRRNVKDAGKKEQAVPTNTVKQDVPHAPAQCKKVAVAELPKVQNTSRGQTYRQWPKTVNSLTTTHVKEKRNVLKSMREQFNMKQPKNAQEEEPDQLSNCNGKIFKILESMREQFNGETPMNKDVARKETDGITTSEGDLPRDSSSHSGQKVLPTSKRESHAITSISPNISVKISNKRNIIGERKGGPECPAMARKTSQTERRKRHCKETTII